MLTDLLKYAILDALHKEQQRLAISKLSELDPTIRSSHREAESVLLDYIRRTGAEDLANAWCEFKTKQHY